MVEADGAIPCFIAAGQDIARYPGDLSSFAASAFDGEEDRHRQALKPDIQERREHNIPALEQPTMW